MDRPVGARDGVDGACEDVGPTHVARDSPDPGTPLRHRGGFRCPVPSPTDPEDRPFPEMNFVYYISLSGDGTQTSSDS